MCPPEPRIGLHWDKGLFRSDDSKILVTRSPWMRVGPKPTDRIKRKAGKETHPWKELEAGRE